MKVATAVLVIVGGFLLYNHVHGSGKSASLPGYKTSRYEPGGANPYLTDTKRMSAKDLEQLLDEDTFTWAPESPVHMRCRRHAHWDYECTDSYLHATFGVNVDTSKVTSFRLLKYAGGS
jgi:hypothetical protein